MTFFNAMTLSEDVASPQLRHSPKTNSILTFVSNCVISSAESSHINFPHIRRIYVKHCLYSHQLWSVDGFNYERAHRAEKIESKNIKIHQAVLELLSCNTLFGLPCILDSYLDNYIFIDKKLQFKAPRIPSLAPSISF